MTGREHYAEAERLLKPISSYMLPERDAIALAQVHATLALADAMLPGALDVLQAQATVLKDIGKAGS